MDAASKKPNMFIIYVRILADKPFISLADSGALGSLSELHGAVAHNPAALNFKYK